ncbi:MAG: hypothetical protein ACQGVC_12920 [Myxococcota bacterium]
MRRRFGRGRRRGSADEGNDTAAPIDGPALMAAIAESGLAGSEAIEAIDLPGVAPGFAALGQGGESTLVAASPRGGGEALFAALALARSREGFGGRVYAIAPSWSIEARRRIAALAPQGFEWKALAAPQLFEGAAEVGPAPAAAPLAVAPATVGAGLGRPEDRELFRRALAGLEGLAAKHGGAVRGVGDRVELLLLGGVVASLRVGSAGLRLDLAGPDRASLGLAAEGLAGALDRLEGSLRKQLNDRRIRASEAGLRASLLPAFESALALSRSARWPLPDAGVGPVDLAGVDGEGRLVVAAAREQVDLRAAGDVLDAALDPRLRWSLAQALGVAPRDGAASTRLAIAGRDFDEAALQVLSLVTVAVEAYEVATGRGEPGLTPRRLPEGASRVAATAAVSPAEAADAEPSRTVDDTGADADGSGQAPGAAEGDEGSEERPERPRGRRSRGGRSRRRGGARSAAAEGAGGDDAPAPARAAAEVADAGASEGFEEVSLFDLDEDASEEVGEGPRRRRRSRGGRRRGRRGGQGRAAESDADGGDDASPEAAPKSRARDGDDEELVDDDAIGQLADDAPELEVSVDLAYEDQDSGEEGDDEADKARAQAEARRRARAAKVEPDPPKPPRRRAAFVAHADRMSVLTAALLARDVRLVESFWVYPQEDLMTFFRSVATDLREETPIFLVGFTASPPARDTLQAASLYRGRLHWFDHHDWPPEDLVALQEAIGEDAVHITPGGESSLATVIAERTRRSRFSDKLVELATGRFTQHDFERWGRVWWHRAGEIAGRRGDRRADIEPLLAGRPSDLAKEAARVAPPPLPEELSYVSQHDFRLVHFGGFVMVVLEVPETLDIHLAGRIARERYGAQLSLASRAGGELLVLGGDESRTRRGLDLGGMAAHLASKHDWITALPDDDFVARLRVRDLRSVPGRLDEVVSEIAMGRSIVEG